nr:uncharacterized protein LOC109173561 [Ipomoea batatas]
MEAIQKINDQLNIEERSETEVEVDSQVEVIPIQVGNLNFQIEADKLEAIFARSRNGEGSVEELLADHFVHNVTEIIEERKEEMRKESDNNPTMLEMAFIQKLRSKVIKDKVPLVNSKGVSFAAAPGGEPVMETEECIDKEKGKQGMKMETVGGSNVASVMVESDRGQLLGDICKVGLMEIKYSRCLTSVNCLACCLANRAEGDNVVWRGGALPHGFQRLMDLEGVWFGCWADDGGLFDGFTLRLEQH